MSLLSEGLQKRSTSWPKRLMQLLRHSNRRKEGDPDFIGHYRMSLRTCEKKYGEDHERGLTVFVREQLSGESLLHVGLIIFSTNTNCENMARTQIIVLCECNLNMHRFKFS